MERRKERKTEHWTSLSHEWIEKKISTDYNEQFYGLRLKFILKPYCGYGWMKVIPKLPSTRTSKPKKKKRKKNLRVIFL